MVDPDSIPVDATIHQTDRLIQGLTLIRKYASDDLSIATESGCLYFGAYEDTISQMSDDEQRSLFAWGWFEMDESWAMYIG